MTNDKADFTQGNILKKLVAFMMPVLGALILQAAYGAVGSSCSWKIRFHIRTVSGFHRKSGTESGYLCSDPVFAMGITVLIARYLGEKKTGADWLRYRWGCNRLYHDLYRAVYCYGRFCTSDFHADAGTGRSGSADCILCTDLWQRNFLYCRV